MMEYDVVTGVSAGSINTFAVAVFNIGKEGDLVEFLSNAWSHLTNPDIWQNWSGGYYDGIVHQSGVLDDHPLYNFLHNIG